MSTAVEHVECDADQVLLAVIPSTLCALLSARASLSLLDTQLELVRQILPTVFDYLSAILPTRLLFPHASCENRAVSTLFGTRL